MNTKIERELQADKSFWIHDLSSWTFERLFSVLIMSNQIIAIFEVVYRQPTHETPGRVRPWLCSCVLMFFELCWRYVLCYWSSCLLGQQDKYRTSRGNLCFCELTATRRTNFDFTHMFAMYKADGFFRPVPHGHYSLSAGAISPRTAKSFKLHASPHYEYELGMSQNGLRGISYECCILYIILPCTQNWVLGPICFLCMWLGSFKLSLPCKMKAIQKKRYRQIV